MILIMHLLIKKNNVVRMISARIASAPERERYYNGEGEL